MRPAVSTATNPFFVLIVSVGSNLGMKSTRLARLFDHP